MNKNNHKKTVPVMSDNLTNRIGFGFDRASDEQSLQLFLESLIKPELLQVLLPRLDDAELTSTVDFFTGLMQKHLTKKEYHELFLSAADI